MTNKNNPTKRRSVFLAILVLAAALVLPAGAFSAPGGGSQGGGQGKDRRPSDPGGSIKGDLLGDLWVVVRDVGTGGNGEPIRFTWNWLPQYSETGIPEGALPIQDDEGNYYNEGVDGGCVQPISFTELNPPPKSDGTQFTYDYVNSYGDTETVYLIPLDTECNIPDVYAGTWGLQVTEVDSGRLALARTTQYVIDSAYEEALTALNDATSVTLGPAGRLQIVPSDAPERIIDSPRENLALYQRLMIDGCLSSTANVSLTPAAQAALTAGGLGNLVCPDSDTSEDNNADLQVAASFLAGAADKSGDIGIDEIVYLNSILGINTVVTSQTDGSIVVTGYFDFGNFTYHRKAIYGGREADLLQPTVFDENNIPTTYEVYDNFRFAGSVFGTTDGVLNDWNGTNSPLSTMPIINFVRAADDAVSVIFYIHNYELPVYVEGPVETNTLGGESFKNQRLLPLK